MATFPVLEQRQAELPPRTMDVSPDGNVRAHLRWLEGAVTSLTYFTFLARVVINNVMRGKINALGERKFTLTANTTTTTLTDERISPDSAIIFDPLTKTAREELASGGCYVLSADRGAGSATVTHLNSTYTDRDYRIVILG